MLAFYIFIFILSCILLLWSGKTLVKNLTKMARFLGWKEFVVAFFVMAFAGSSPNLFVGVNSALHKIPELSFGDVIGGNVICLTLAVALAVFISRVSIPADSGLIQTSSLFTFFIAVLPIFLFLDGILNRVDGFILISVFFVYIFWLFSKEERFKKVYEKPKKDIAKGLRGFFYNLSGVVFSLFLLLLASEGIVKSASFFADNLNLNLPLIGILIIGLGNALPEIYFAVISAKHGETWMILGSLMGSVIVLATLVLGIVVIIHPIELINFSSFALARFFLIISAMFFFFCVRTDCRITKKEALLLLSIYIIFIVSQILLA